MNCHRKKKKKSKLSRLEEKGMAYHSKVEGRYQENSRLSSRRLKITLISSNKNKNKKERREIITFYNYKRKAQIDQVRQQDPRD